MKIRPAKGLITAVGTILLSMSVPVWAAEYYVDQGHPNASDNNPGTEARPWRSLYRAAQESLQPGDTVYIKAGTYDASQGGNWAGAAVKVPSGAPGKPVTFKSLPAHAAVLDSRGANPAIGVNRGGHVVIDGFVIPNPGERGISIFGEPGRPVRDVVIQNNIIYGSYVRGFDNAEGIRLENAEQILVRNNKIYNSSNDNRTWNASAVKTYKTKNVTIEHNEMFDVVSGVMEKEASSYLTIRNNRIHTCRYGFVLSNQNGGVTEAVKFHNNIVQCNSGFETVSQGSAEMRDVHVYNNTFAGYTSQGANANRHGQAFYIYNNIFHRTSSSVSNADFYTQTGDTGQVKLMDYNLYSRNPKMVIGLYSLDRTYNSLAAWQAAGHRLDANSLLADPKFVNAAAGDFRLAAGSPALMAGRDSSGKAVNIGAYAIGNEVIGLLPASGKEDAPPSAPKLLKAQ